METEKECPVKQEQNQEVYCDRHRIDQRILEASDD